MISQAENVNRYDNANSDLIQVLITAEVHIEVIAFIFLKFLYSL